MNEIRNLFTAAKRPLSTCADKGKIKGTSGDGTSIHIEKPLIQKLFSLYHGFLHMARGNFIFLTAFAKMPVLQIFLISFTIFSPLFRIIWYNGMN